MALKRSTKTIQDLIQFAKDKMRAGLDEIKQRETGIYCEELRFLAHRFHTRCIIDFPSAFEDCNQHKLLPIFQGSGLLIHGSLIIYGEQRPDWAIWSTVHKYLEVHQKELEL